MSHALFLGAGPGREIPCREAGLPAAARACRQRPASPVLSAAPSPLLATPPALREREEANGEDSAKKAKKEKKVRAPRARNAPVCLVFGMRVGFCVPDRTRKLHANINIHTPALPQEKKKKKDKGSDSE